MCSRDFSFVDWNYYFVRLLSVFKTAVIASHGLFFKLQRTILRMFCLGKTALTKNCCVVNCAELLQCVFFSHIHLILLTNGLYTNVLSNFLMLFLHCMWHTGSGNSLFFLSCLGLFLCLLLLLLLKIVSVLWLL